VISGLRLLAGPLLAAVEARVALAAALAVRRAALLIAATLFGVGALLFLSIGVFFGLMPGVGPAGAALILALIWALTAGLCYVLSLLRPRRLSAAATLPPVAPMAAPPPPAPPAARVAGAPPPHPAFGGRISRAAPLLAIAALVAGIIAGRR
jgi:hypothetical protein